MKKIQKIFFLRETLSTDQARFFENRNDEYYHYEFRYSYEESFLGSEVIDELVEEGWYITSILKFENYYNHLKIIVLAEKEVSPVGDDASEQQYLELYRDLKKLYGQLGYTEKQLLDKTRERLGISRSRATEIEDMID